MSKASADHGQPETSTAEEVEDTGVDQPLRTLSREGLTDDLELFAETYGLLHHLNVLQKAALLLHTDADNDETPDLTHHEQTALHNETTHKWRQPWLLYFTIFVCSLGAVEQGWAQTGMNGANLYLPATLGIDSRSTRDSFLLGLLNCGIYLANACWGSWLSEPVNTSLGRRGAVFVANVLCLIGNLGSGLSGSWPFLLLFRLVC